jgi:hypothetical protein
LEYFAHQCFEILRHFFGRFSRGNVVIPRVENDHTRLVNQCDAVEVTERVFDVRPAESPVDDRIIGEVFFHVPTPDAGASQKENSLFGEKRLPVLFLEFLNRRLPGRRGVRFSLGLGKCASTED